MTVFCGSPVSSGSLPSFPPPVQQMLSRRLPRDLSDPLPVTFISPAEFYDADPDALRAAGLARVRLAAHRDAFTSSGARADDCRESHGFTLSLDGARELRPLPHAGLCRCRFILLGPRDSD